MRDSPSNDAPDEHLAGCPAAVDVPGAHEPCRCDELARLFDVPTRDECFGEDTPAQAHARWREARGQAAQRHTELLRELDADADRAFARLRETASSTAELGRHIALARELLERQRRPRRGLG